MKVPSYKSVYESPKVLANYVMAQMELYAVMVKEGRDKQSELILLNILAVMFVLKEDSTFFKQLEKLVSDETITRKPFITRVYQQLKAFKAGVKKHGL